MPSHKLQYKKCLAAMDAPLNDGCLSCSGGAVPSAPLTAGPFLLCANPSHARSAATFLHCPQKSSPAFKVEVHPRNPARLPQPTNPLSWQELLPISTVRACYWQTIAAASKEREQHVINNLLKHCQRALGPCLFLRMDNPLLNATFIRDGISA